jgi:hypothetical protein
LIALFVQGTPILSPDFIRPFSVVVGTVTIVVAVFNKYAWSWRIFYGWYVNRPDIRGTWKVELESDWVEPNTNLSLPTIAGYAVVHQTLTSLSILLMTKESRSRLIANSIELEGDGLYKLAAIYRNEPKIELQGNRSEIHFGAILLEIYGNPPTSLEGHYWTDRHTRGSMKLKDRHRELYDTYELAEVSFKS